MGVIGFTITLAVDVGRFNITANAICPGGSGERNVELARARAEYMGKPFEADAYHKQMEERTQKGVLAGRWLEREGYLQKPSTPEDAAIIALFLASDEAGSITGQDINVVNGGCMW